MKIYIRNKKKRNLIINIFLLIIVLLIFLIFTEVILRYFGLSCSIVDKNNDAPFLISDEGYHYMKSNYNGRFKCITFDTMIKTNSYGFRDNGFNITENGIILLGDSITFGYGVEQDETFAQILENDLSSKGTDVYNLGVAGYGLKEYNWIYDKYSKELKHELVILALYEGNDFQESCNLIDRAEFVADERKGFGFIKDSLKRSYTFRFLYPLTKNIINLGETAITSKQFYTVDESEEIKNCNEMFKEELNKLKSKVVENNKDLIVLIFTSKVTFIESSDPKIDYKKRLNILLDFCSELDLNCINFKDYIIDMNKVYMKDSGHPNKEGHIEIAKLLYNYIAKYE